MPLAAQILHLHKRDLINLSKKKEKSYSVHQVNVPILLISLKTSAVCILALTFEKSFSKLQIQMSQTVRAVLVREFSKLLSINGGKHGVPEYGHAVIAFPDFLALTRAIEDHVIA